MEPFDGLNQNCTPEENLQHFEARVTFSLGLQPTTDHEYKIWHARRMVVIQCSLQVQLSVGTFVRHLKNKFHHRKTPITPTLKPLMSSKRTMTHIFSLPLKFINS